MERDYVQTEMCNVLINGLYFLKPYAHRHFNCWPDCFVFCKGI